MSDFTIRKANPGDIDEIVSQRRRMFEDMGVGDPNELEAMQATSRPFIADGLQSGTYHGWLAEWDGRIAGGGGVVMTPWPSHPRDPNVARKAYILNIYVYRDFRRRGVARAVMNAILESCRHEGFGTVSLHASQHGRPLYESLGFEPTNEMRLKL